MIGKILKIAVLIIGILCGVFSLSACDRMKAEIGFKWGQILKHDPYREVKNTPEDIGPAVRIKRNITIQTDSGMALSGPSERSA